MKRRFLSLTLALTLVMSNIAADTAILHTGLQTVWADEIVEEQSESTEVATETDAKDDSKSGESTEAAETIKVKTEQDTEDNESKPSDEKKSEEKVELQEVEVIDYLEYQVNEDGSTVTITGYVEEKLPAVDSGVPFKIPGTIDEKTVTAIGDSAFSNMKGNDSYNELQLPSTIKRIGENAFNGWSYLTSITLNDGLESIGSKAFYGCASLASVTIPNTVTEIGDNVFYLCTSLKSVQLSSTLEKVGYRAFASIQIESITIPATLVEIGDEAFSSIKEISFDEETTKIPDRVCVRAGRLEKINWPSKVTEIGDSAFFSCSSLTFDKIPDTVTIIGNSAFDSCTSLTSVKLPSKLEKIGDRAFSDTKIESIEIPSTLTEIGGGTFDSIKEVSFGAGTTVVQPYLCSGAINLKKINWTSDINTIGGGAFYGCTSLASVTIPDTVTEIGQQAFCDCSSLTDVILSSKLEKVGDNAFTGTDIGSIEIPATLTSIGYLAFSSIKEVSFAAGTTVIPADVCYRASSLEKINWPKGLTEIGTNAFYQCSSLGALDDIPATVKNIGGSAFYNSSVTSVTIPAGVGVDSNAFEDCYNLKKIVIGDNVSLNGYSFSNCTNLESVTIGNNVTIDDSAFSGSEKTGSIGANGTDDSSVKYSYSWITSELKIIGSGDMMDFEKAEDVPWYATKDKIKSIDISRDITRIGDYTFTGINTVSQIDLPSALEEVGKHSFKDCKALERVVVKNRVELIDTGAFEGCDKLKEIFFYGDAPVLAADCIPDLSTITIVYPEAATGWNGKKLRERFKNVKWKSWDNTVTTRDIVLVLDHSGSMSDTMDSGDTRMEALKKAAKAFVSAVGGPRSNNNIAIVMFDDSAEVIADFSKDTDYLNQKIDSMHDDGGTYYIPAMKMAEDLLKYSDASSKSIILFSDGEPFESKEDIQEVAEALSKQYGLYSVGLVDPDNSVSAAVFTTEEEFLIAAVNGNESHYFRATDIDSLIKAFIDIAQETLNNEYTVVEIKRNGQRYNAVSEDVIFVKGSGESVEINTIPSAEIEDKAAKYELQVNFVAIENNTTGVFNMAPGLLLKDGDYVEIVIYDAAGNELERNHLKIRLSDEYKITFYLNDGTDTIYDQYTVASGNEIKEPEDEPERAGYKFKGWFANAACSGFPFFSPLNKSNKLRVDSDTSLYAAWEDESTLDLKKDAWRFANSGEEFCTPGYNDLEWYEQFAYDYEISAGDWAKLMENIANSPNDNTRTYAKIYKRWAKEAKKDVWGGSCFGMSAAAVLVKTGAIDIMKFDPKYSKVGKAELDYNKKGDADVGSIESMINYYYLYQVVGEINNLRNNGDGDESVYLSSIIDKMKKSGKPVVLCLNIYEDKDLLGGHAVVAYNLKGDDTNGYTFEVYDCSLGNEESYPVTVTKSGSTYSKECSDWEDAWDENYNFRLTCALTSEELQSEKILKESAMVIASADDDWSIASSYKNFTLTKLDSTDTEVASAKITNGAPESGATLDVEALGNSGEPNGVPKYNFKVAKLGDGEKYKINNNESSSDGSFITTIANSDDDGFSTNITTGNYGYGTITVDSTGKVTTNLNSCKQTIRSSREYDNARWSYVNVSGETSGLTLDPAKEQITISSTSNTKLDIAVESDLNMLEFNKTEVVGGEDVVITGDTEDNVVFKNGTAKEVKEPFGYAAVFDSQQGNPVPTQYNLEKGDKIDEPNDPKKNGFTFTGWYKEADLKTEWDFDNDTIDGDTVVYAGWELDPNYFVKVTFRMKGAKDNFTYIGKDTKLDDFDCPTPDDDDKTWYADGELKSKWDYDTRVTKNTILYSNGWEEGRYVDVKSLKLDVYAITMNRGDKRKLKAEVNEDATDKIFKWLSSDTNIVTVDDDGNVEAKKAGEAKVTVTSGGEAAVCEITVVEPVTGVSLDKTSAELTEGETVQLTATVTPADASNKSLKWESSASNIAKVNDNGLVTAVAEGSAEITVTTVDGGFTDKCSINVKAKNKPDSTPSGNKASTEDVVPAEGKIISAGTVTIGGQPYTVSYNSTMLTYNGGNLKKILKNAIIFTDATGAKKDVKSISAKAKNVGKVTLKSVKFTDKTKLKASDLSSLNIEIAPRQVSVNGTKNEKGALVYAGLNTSKTKIKGDKLKKLMVDMPNWDKNAKDATESSLKSGKQYVTKKINMKKDIKSVTADGNHFIVELQNSFTGTVIVSKS